MTQKYIHISSVALILISFFLVFFIYSTEPRSFAEVSTKGQVILGSYKIDQSAFDQGLATFRRDEFPAARALFETADPEKRDAATQFYIAYSYYRQGWGRISNDDALFRSGLEAVGRVIAIDANYRTADETLWIKTAAELKDEFDEGLKITPSDFNPMKITRERK